MNRDLTGIELSALLLIVAAVTLFAYYPGMSAGFYFDDEPNLLEVTALHWNEVSLALLQRALDEALLPSRPVANVSMALNHVFAQLDPAPYHWTNLAMHLAVGLTLFWVIRLFQLHHASASHGRWIALLAVLLFLVHPLNVQAVTYMVQRMTLLATLFLLLGLGCYVTGRYRVTAAPRLAWFVLAALSFLLAVGSKELGLLLLPLLLLYELSFHRAYWRECRAALVSRTGRPIVLAAGGALLLVVLSIAWHLFADSVYWSEIMPARDYSGLERVLTQGRVQFLYLSLLLWPSPSRLNLDHEFLVSRSLLEPTTTLLALAGLLLIVILALRSIPDRPKLAFPVLAYFLLHSIESAPINLELVFEHRMYLPMTMLALALALNPGAVRSWAGLSRYTVLMAIVMLLAMFTYERNLTWSDPLVLYRDAAQKSPSKFRPQYNLGTEMGKRGRLDMALDALEQALIIKPTSSKAHNQLANVYLLQGGQLAAERHYRLAIEYDATNAEALFNLANLLSVQRRYTERRKVLEQFVLHAPPYLEQQKQSALRDLGR
jgi:hypothetical protein